MNALTLILLMFWYILPAYAANGLAVVFGRGSRLNIPLDLGKNFIDGRRIFGAGKTLRGFLGGILAGTLVGFAQTISGNTIGIFMLRFSPVTLQFILMLHVLGFQSLISLIILNSLLLSPFYFALLDYPLTIKEVIIPSPVKGFLLSMGALVGDLAGSFIKRRLKMERGKPAPGLDQLDFVIGAILLSSIFYVPPIEILVTALLLTPAVHLTANITGYALNLKKEPW
ncbi:MAG: CDP-2,3-bis-(O-geranylgeranyl)-sn-glycerol synthase [Candidatus Freyarchaeota archaeon]